MRNKLLAGLACLVLAACGTTSTGSTAQPTDQAAPPTEAPTAEPTADLNAMEIKAMPIDSFDIQVMESAPPQVSIQVQGSLADACTSLGEIKQSRSGNVIEVTITTVRPKDMMCAQRLEIFSQTIQLEGEFTSGEYIIRVNGNEQTIKI